MQRISDRRPELTWDSHGWDWRTEKSDTGDWAVMELLSSSALRDESKALHHCVQSYDRRCALKGTARSSVSRMTKIMSSPLSAMSSTRR